MDCIKATAVQRGEWHDPEAASETLIRHVERQADVLLNSRILGERYDHDCNQATNRLESAKADHEDEQGKQQAVDEWKRQLDIVGAEYGRVRAKYIRSVHDHQSASRSIVYTEDEVVYLPLFNLNEEEKQAIA